MKKIFAVLLAAGMCFLFAACAPSGSADAGDDAGGGQELPGGETPDEELPDDADKDPDEGQPGSPDEDPDGEEETTGNKAYAEYARAGYSALFDDPYFTRGFSLIGADGNVSGTLQFTNSYGTPAWTFAQWATRYDLSDYRSRSYSKGGAAFVYTAKGKTIDGAEVPAKVFAADSTNASLYMELNAQSEYDAPRQDGEGWPHTLLSQDFSGNLVHVSELSSLVMDMDFTVTKFEDCMGDEADPGKHCAQFVWYITLQNRTPESEGYGQYIWFGLNLWDNRNVGKVSAEYAAQDTGKEDATLAFIYQPSGDKFYPSGKTPAVGEHAKINFELLDTAKYAFELARSRGYLADTSWEDIYVGGMNFGFEITGTYNAAVQIDTVGVYYKVATKEEQP